MSELLLKPRSPLCQKKPRLFCYCVRILSEFRQALQKRDMYAVAEFPSKLLLFTEHSKEVSFSKMLSSSALRHWVVYLCHASLKRRHLGRLFHEMPGVLHFTSIHLVAKAPKCFAASRAAGYGETIRIEFLAGNFAKVLRSFSATRDLSATAAHHLHVQTLSRLTLAP